MSTQVAVLVGSLRKDSYNLKVARALAELADKELTFKFIKIDDLPFYNEDIDGGSPPESYVRFRKEIAESQAVLFVMPEYNRSLPAVIKNAIDVGSRPYGYSVWAKKPAGVVTCSQGAVGGFGANHHLRQSFVFLDVYALEQPEMYLGHIQDSFDEKGQITERTKNMLAQFLSAYQQWIKKMNG